MENGTTGNFWVGIGASAGGLEALREVVRHLEPTTGAVYVVLQHMSPQHKSLLTQLIGRETSLKVVEITDGIVPQPDTIYISPPNADVVVSSRSLRLADPSQEPAAPKPSIDRFLESLAKTKGSRAIGIILSGTGSDGATGIRAIRAAGGITIAQTEASAKYNGMPISAVDTGCVDLVLSATEIGTSFAEIVKLPRNLSNINTSKPTDALANLFQLLQLRTGVDFREYKPSTVRRRIERRMTSLSLDDLDTYAAHVREHPDEVKLLFRDMMISVTSFFRDREEFENFQAQLKTVVDDQAHQGMRVWVPGCASGEEAYTIMILIAECLGGIQALDEAQVQVFATDIDADALATARRGRYPKSIEKEVPKALLDTYFNPVDDGYQVNQSLRERIVFTPHNVCQDPPFSNIDVISCRNILIYFNNALQAKVFARLHYALKPSGLMFLGKSESISGSEALFRPASDRGQVFRRRAHSDRTGLPRKHTFGASRAAQSGGRARSPERAEADGFGSMFRALVRAIGPNGLLVTSEHHILRVYGNVDRFLSLPEGQLRGATISMLRDDLRHELRTLMALSMRNNETRRGLVRVLEPDSDVRVQLEVHPVGDVEDAEGMVLVIFKEWQEERVSTPALPAGDDEAMRGRVVELEEELLGTRESLQQTVEELETANEELQSLNEEMQSANEELQSTNEELETTNEELQSTNEELITVNEELQINSHEMAAINQELDSILSNIAAPVLVVDTRLHIVQCSQSARQMFKIAAGAAKPHLSQLSLPGEFPELNGMMAQVVQTGTPMEHSIDLGEFRGTVTAAPYFNSKGELIGATAIVQEISEKGADPETMKLLLDNLPLMIWRRDSDGKVVDANEAAARFMGVDRRSARGMALDGVVNRLGEAFVTGSHLLPAPGLSGSPRNGHPMGPGLLSADGDGPKDSETVMVVAANTGAATVPTQDALSWELSPKDREVAISPGTAALLGVGNGATVLSLDRFLELFQRDDRSALAYGVDAATRHAIPFTVLAGLGSGAGTGRVRVRGHAEKDEDGNVSRIVGTIGGGSAN